MVQETFTGTKKISADIYGGKICNDPYGQHPCDSELCSQSGHLSGAGHPGNGKQGQNERPWYNLRQLGMEIEHLCSFCNCETTVSANQNLWKVIPGFNETVEISTDFSLLIFIYILGSSSSGLLLLS